MTSSKFPMPWGSDEERNASRKFYVDKVFNVVQLNIIAVNQGLFWKLIEDMENPEDWNDWIQLSSDAIKFFDLDKKFPSAKFWYSDECKAK